MYLRPLSPQAGDTKCVNTHGNIVLVMDPLTRHKPTIAIGISGFHLSPCVDTTAIDSLHLVCCLWVGSLAMCAVVL